MVPLTPSPVLLSPLPSCAPLLFPTGFHSSCSAILAGITALCSQLSMHSSTPQFQPACAALATHARLVPAGPHCTASQWERSAAEQSPMQVTIPQSLTVLWNCTRKQQHEILQVLPLVL